MQTFIKYLKASKQLVSGDSVYVFSKNIACWYHHRNRLSDRKQLSQDDQTSNSR